MIDEAVWQTKKGAILVELVGGIDIANALVRHHEQGESIRSIARSMTCPARSLTRHITVAHVRLRRLGIMPQHWEAATKRHAVRNRVVDINAHATI